MHMELLQARNCCTLQPRPVPGVTVIDDAKQNPTKTRGEKRAKVGKRAAATADHDKEKPPQDQYDDRKGLQDLQVIERFC